MLVLLLLYVLTALRMKAESCAHPLALKLVLMRERKAAPC